MEVPVPARNGAYQFPPVTLTAQLCQVDPVYGTVTNVFVPDLEGKQVNFTLGNEVRLGVNQAGKPGPYHAKLTGGTATLTLGGATVAGWFEPAKGWATLNVNLLTFRVELPDVADGQTLYDYAEPYYYFYCRKSILFLPGVMGSKLAIKNPDGSTTPIYPHYGIIDVPWGIPDGLAEGQYQTGELECDGDGKPLYETEQELFQLIGSLPGRVPNFASAAVVYDVITIFESQWDETCDRFKIPHSLRPYKVIAWPYDWRLNLEGTALQLKTEVEALQAKLRREDDMDDRVALSGHSTGGLIVRRVSGFPGIEAFVDHSFFMNVPFQGAPKAVSVFVFGGDPPIPGRFSALVPVLISLDSMLQTGPNLPIMYFLSASASYPDPVSHLDRALDPIFPNYSYGPGSRETEKEKFINFAEYIGLIVRPRPPQPGLTEADRQRIASASDDWSENYWFAIKEAKQRLGIPLSNEQTQNAWQAAKDECWAEGAWSETVRSRTPDPSWNRTIAAQAREFHRLSEDAIKNSKVHLWVFWSRNNTTCGKTTAKLVKSQPFSEGPIPVADSDNDFTFSFKDNNTRHYYKLQFSAVGVDGDGTVPLTSLLGIGTDKAKYFTALVGNPSHVAAPNADEAWGKVISTLLFGALQEDSTFVPPSEITRLLAGNTERSY